MNIEQASGREFPEMMEFLLRCFRTVVPDHEPFEDIYPDLYQPTDESMEVNYVIRDGGRIVSMAGLFPLELKLDRVALQVAGIGGVATDPDHRGKGYMSALMGHLKQEVCSRGYAVSWLTGERDRYAHFVWEKAGTNLTIVIHELKETDVGPWFLEQLDAADGSLEQLIEARSRLRIKGVCDEKVLREKFSRLHTQVWEARSGDAYAYAVLNHKDKRLAEWGGDAEGVRALVKRSFRACGELRIGVPPVRDEYMNLMLSFSPQYESCADNLAVFDLRLLLLAYEPFFESSWPQGRSLSLVVEGDSASACCIDSGEIVGETDSNALRVSLDPLRMASFLYGPVRPTVLLELADEHGWLDEIFPLPFHMPWLWRV